MRLTVDEGVQNVFSILLNKIVDISKDSTSTKSAKPLAGLRSCARLPTTSCGRFVMQGTDEMQGEMGYTIWRIYRRKEYAEARDKLYPRNERMRQRR